MHKIGLGEPLLQWAAPLGKKDLDEDKRLDSTNQKQKQLKTVTWGEETQMDDKMRSMKGTYEMDEELKHKPESNCIAASPRDNTLTTHDGINTSKLSPQPTSVTEKSDEPLYRASGKPCTMGDIFRDLLRSGFSSYCALSLVQAVADVTHKKSSQQRVSTQYCVSQSRVQHCLSMIKLCRESKYENYHQMLKKIHQYPAIERIKEWLLRMRRMGRSPVSSDVKQVFRFTATTETLNRSIAFFTKLYAEQNLSQEEWAVLTLLSTKKWHFCFVDHIFLNCNMAPNAFLTAKNSPQVFTSAEVLLGLGDLPQEVVVARGRSNLYCLTQRDQGVAQAILTFSAAGQFCPPVIFQKGYYIPHWALSEDSVDLIASPDGRWDPLVFLSWLRLFDQRLTVTEVPRPVVLFVHGHPAHASPAVDAFCSAKRIILHSHHYSAINPMDPFIHLIPPFLHHFARTQEQLTALTGVHPLPDHLLPSVLADAWTQVSKENLAGEAFRRSGLVPYTIHKYFPTEKYTRMSFFPPLVLHPQKTYFSVGDLPQELPYQPEPQLDITLNLYTANLHQKLSVLDKVKLTDEISTCSSQGENYVEENSDTISEPHCTAPESSNNPSMVESGTVPSMQDDADSSPDMLPQEVFDNLPLECEIQEKSALYESLPSSPDNHESPTAWEKAEDFDNSNQVCDPLYIGPDPLPDPSVMESAGIIHIHSDTTTTMRLPPLEKVAEQLDSTFTCKDEKSFGCSEPRMSSPQKKTRPEHMTLLL